MPKKYVLLSFYLTVSLFCFGQSKDTLVIRHDHILFVLKHSENSKKNGKEYYSINHKEVTKEEYNRISNRFDEFLDSLYGNPYVIFLNKHNQRTEEGYWEKGVRITYHTNGRVKDRGEYTLDGARNRKKTGKWEYFNKKGKLVKTETY